MHTDTSGGQKGGKKRNLDSFLEDIKRYGDMRHGSLFFKVFISSLLLFTMAVFVMSTLSFILITPLITQAGHCDIDIIIF